MRTRRKKKTIEDMAIDKLLDDLIATDAPVDTKPAEDPWSEEYLMRLHKREAKKTLEKYKRDEPLNLSASAPKPEPPVVSEKMSQVRKCQNCYYCIASRKVSGSWWCHCTNPGRSTECEVQTHSWVTSKLNLSCWKPLVQEA